MRKDTPATEVIAPSSFHVNLNERFVRRFWEKIQKSDPADCWIWKRCKNKLGYGMVMTTSDGVKLSHRVAFFLQNGPFDKKLKVCHSCDNPGCCNPAHLWLGTDKENVADMYRKGRNVKGRTYYGSEHANAKLTEAIVIEMRAKYAAGNVMQKELAAQYGIRQQAIQRILAGKRWRHCL